MNAKKKINLMDWTISPIIRKKKKKIKNINDRGYKDIMMKKKEIKNTNINNLNKAAIPNSLLSNYTKNKKKYDKRIFTEILSISNNSDHSKISNNNKSANISSDNTAIPIIKENRKSLIHSSNNNIISLTRKNNNKDNNYINTSYDNSNTHIHKMQSKDSKENKCSIGISNGKTDIKTPTSYYNHTFTKLPQFKKNKDSNSKVLNSSNNNKNSSSFSAIPKNIKNNNNNIKINCSSLILKRLLFKNNHPKYTENNNNNSNNNINNKNWKLSNFHSKNYKFSRLNKQNTISNYSNNSNKIIKMNSKPNEHSNSKKKQILSKAINRSTDDIKNIKNTQDDDDGNYLYKIGEFIINRYEILSSLGKGSFGQAVKCYDNINKEYVCIKIIKNKPKFKSQCQIEIKLLKYINSHDLYHNSNIVILKMHFIYKNHICLVFELLSSNLYEVLQNNNYIGFNLSTIKKFTTQILFSLLYTKKYHIIHCDLKPENILLITNGKTGIKLIDFGSSCFSNEKLYTYIQSRFYRAPEIILGLNYDIEIDMWSLGCILCELYTGYPIFPGEDEYDMLYYMMEYFGVPPKEILENSVNRLNFFDERGNVYERTNSFGKIRRPNTKVIENFLFNADLEFVDFVKQCLVWDRERRMKPEDALRHKWVIGEMPRDVLKQHYKKMREICDNDTMILKGNRFNQENYFNLKYNIYIDFKEENDYTFTSSREKKKYKRTICIKK